MDNPHPNGRNAMVRRSGQDIVANYDYAYDCAYQAWNSFFPLAERDLRFFLGDQWDEGEKREMFQEGRSTFVYNLVRPNINMVSGYQRKHRHSSVVTPIEASDQQTADQMTKLLLYAMQYGDGYECISDCFSGALKTGWNLLSIWKDYRNDPVNGDICFSREPYNGFITDPYFYKKDLSDCGYLLRRKYLNLPMAQSLLPNYKKELKELYKLGWERDDKFTWLPYQNQPNGQALLAYSEHWEQGFETKKYIHNSLTGIMVPYNEDTQDLIFADPNTQVVEKVEQYIDQHIIVNDEYIHTERNPYGLNEYPFVPFFCLWEPESSQWDLKCQSLIRTMVDPQREANRRRSQMIDIVESQINSGWIADEDAVINPRSLFQSSQGKVIWRKRDAKPGALERIQPANLPPGFFQLKEMHDNDLMKVANISEELLGQADSEQDSGLKVMLRQGAALVGLQDILDNLRFSQELVARKSLKMIQDWSAQKMQRIINEELTEQLKDKQTIKFDIAVQEGILTDTQQQMFFSQMLTLKQMGEPVPPGFLARIAPLQGKTEYLQAMEQFNKAQQKQQKAMLDAQLKQQQAQNHLFTSQAVNNIAGAKERFTRSISNLGLEDERASKAVENRADANLRRAQAVKELEQMDDERVSRFIEMFMKLEELNALKETQIKQQNTLIAEVAEEQQQQPEEVSNAG